MSDTTPSRGRFAGLRVLVVEDETMVSMLIEQMLEDLGCTSVRCAFNVPDGLAAIDAETPDAAALDVNLRGVPVFPIAAALAERRVPFVFITGYGARGLTPEWADRPVVQKPFSIEALEEHLARALEMAT